MLDNYFPVRITTKVIFDIETGEILARDSYNYAGPLALCKGDPAAEQEEQETAQFDQQLMQIFQQQYATQQSQLQYLQGKMEPMINNPTGYTAQQLASMRTGATDTIAQQGQDAQAALNNEISQSSGGSKLTGVAGANVESDAALLNAESQEQASAQEQITQANANLQQQNYWNAVNALNGVAAMENPLGYAGASNQAGGTVANLSQAVTASQQSQLLGALGGIVGGVGSALGGGFSKGGLFNGCWIAASIYGWNDLRTWILRIWLNTQAPVWFRNFYMQHGERIAQTPLRWAFYPVFEALLEAI